MIIDWDGDVAEETVIYPGLAVTIGFTNIVVDYSGETLSYCGSTNVVMSVVPTSSIYSVALANQEITFTMNDSSYDRWAYWMDA